MSLKDRARFRYQLLLIRGIKIRTRIFIKYSFQTISSFFFFFGFSYNLFFFWFFFRVFTLRFSPLPHLPTHLFTNTNLKATMDESNEYSFFQYLFFTMNIDSSLEVK